MEGKPLFPAALTMQSGDNESSSQQQQKSLVDSSKPVSLFPSVSGEISGSGSQKPVTQPVRSFKSYRQEVVELSDDSSSLDDEDSEDSDVQVIENSDEDRRRRREKRRRRERSRSSSPERRRSSKKHKKEKKRRKEKKSKKRKHRRSRSKSRDRETKKYDNSYLEYLPRGKALFIEDIPNLKSEDAFRLDRRPDGNNRGLASLPHSVPKYTFKNVINLCRDLFKKDNQEEKAKKKKVKRYFTSKKLAKTGDDSASVVYPRQSLFSDVSRQIEFIDLVLEVQTVDKSDDGIKFFSVTEETNESGSIGPKMFPSRSQVIHELTKEFNRSLFEQKANAERWIDFIRFQDLVFHHSIPGGEEDSGKRLQQCVSKKMDICEKALDSNRKSVKLHLIRLRLLSLFADELDRKCSDVDNEWRNVCFLFPNVPRIWFDWIRFTLRGERMVNFRANGRTRKIFRYAFGSLGGKLLEGDFQSHHIEENLEMVLVDLTTFYAEFMASIDQVEKAIGLFQALIEFNLYTPRELGFMDSPEDWYLMFEQFWDSGVSRVGEFGPKSWRQFQELITQQSEEVRHKDPRNLEHFDSQSLTDRLEDQILAEVSESNQPEPIRKALLWLHYEELRKTLHWLPASAHFPTNYSLDDLEDPERVVLSDEDIKPFLYRLRNDDSKFYLSLQFFHFLDVPLVTGSLESAFSTSRFEHEFYFENLLKIDLGNTWNWLFDSIVSKHVTRYSNPSELFVLKRFGFNEQIKIQLPLCESVIREYAAFGFNTRQMFLDNLFTQMIAYFRQGSSTYYASSLTLLWCRHKIDLYQRGKRIKLVAVKKFMKEILRENSECYDLYHLYGNFLYQIDMSEGLKIMLDTLSACRRLGSDSNQSHMLKIACSLVRLNLNLDSILEQFIIHKDEEINLVPKSKVSFPVEQLKQISLNLLVDVLNKPEVEEGRFDLEDLKRNSNPVDVRRAFANLKRLAGESVESVQTSALLTYLAQGLEPALDILGQHQVGSTLVVEPKLRHHLERSFYLLHLELLLRDYAELKQSRRFRAQSPLVPIRGLIDRILSQFPDDPIFLAVMVKVDSKLSVLNRPRRYFNDFVSDSNSKLEQYFVRKYLNKVVEEEEKEENNSGEDQMESLFHVFMATLHSELLIMDKASGDEVTAYDFSSGMSNRIRSLFERVLNYHGDRSRSSGWLQGKTLAHCPLVWRMFVRFEEMERRKSRRPEGKSSTNSTQAILYRAFQNCPNHKALYMEAVTLQPSLLQECLDIMCDQQLRLRTTVEEIELYLSQPKTGEKG